MNFNVDNIKMLVSNAYLPHAREAFGDAGTFGVIRLLDLIRSLFQRCPPERVTGSLTILLGIAGSTPNNPAISSLGPLKICSSLDEIGQLIISSDSTHNLAIEVVSDGTYRLLAACIEIDPILLAAFGMVYHFDGHTERILAKSFDDYVPKVSPLLKSNFAAPTLSSLEDALKRYSDEMAAESQCRILSQVWEGGVDGPRLVFVNKPESLMRDSLIQALQLLTRDSSVKPEQNTDETKPVDIRIDWFASEASALIEVKWLGRSTAKPRNPTPDPTYTDYFPARAQSGADQLADYMDRSRRHSRSASPRGYLVVFDGRRRNVKGKSDLLTRLDGLYFETSDIAYNPDHAKTRTDFSQPYRLFLRPRESCFIE